MHTERICVFGIVQGVGFRPFVSRIAAAHAIHGTVCNKGSYVEILAQGSPAAHHPSGCRCLGYGRHG